MKSNDEQHFAARAAQRSKKFGGPATICRISLCCCLCCCLLPGIGLLGFTYMTYGNYESIQATVVAQEFCGYYRRRRSLKGTGGVRFDPIPNQRRMKKSGYSSGTSSSSSNRKENHYRMTYNFQTPEGENITTATEYCARARRAINSTHWLLYDPDDPYSIVDEDKPTGYLVYGIFLTGFGLVFMCAAFCIYKVFMNVFGDLLSNDNEPTDHSSSSNGAANMFAAAGIGAAMAQMMNQNANNNNNNTTGTSGNASGANKTSAPDTTPTYNSDTNNYNNNNMYANSTSENTYGNNDNAYSNTANTHGNTENNNTDYPSYGNTASNSYGDPNAYNTNTAYNNNSTAYGDSGYNNSNMDYNSTPTAPSAPPASVNMTGYRPP